jgi:hypothetical protein
MRSDVKKFIVWCVDNQKSRKFARDYLFGKISDVQVTKALKFYDRYSENSWKKHLEFKDLPIAFLLLVRISLLFLIYCLLRTYRFFQKLIFGKAEEQSFEEFELSFSLYNYYNLVKEWFVKKYRKEKWIFLLKVFAVVFFIALLIFANFIYFKNCSSQGCFKESVSKCYRAKYVSSDLVPLKNTIVGFSWRGCKVEVESLENDLIDSGRTMTCYLPYGSRNLPQSRIELCSGELREDVQELIISEMYIAVGQNVREINDFFRQVK